MNHAWLVRPYPHHTDINRVKEFKEQEMVAIGWPALGNLTGKSREDIKQMLCGKPYELTGLTLGNTYPTIDNFVNRMHVGDLLLVPDGSAIYFAEVRSDYYFNEEYDNDDTGFPHQRKVKWLCSVSRADLSKKLRDSLKVHRTTADFSKHFEEINALAHGRDYQETSVETATIEVTYPLRKDFKITFEIPADMTRDEAKRVSQYFETLYFSE